MLRFLSVAIATVLTASVWCEKNFSVDEQNISNESSFDESWIEEFQVRTETSFQYTSINIPSHGLARLTRDLCYNYTSDMVVVDTRTTTWDDAVTFLSDNLYFPYLVLYGSLHQDDRFFDSHNWTFFMQPSLSDYGRLFQDLIQLFNVSSDTITVIYDDQNKDLLAVFDSYSEMGSTFLLMFNVRHILDRNVLKELHYTMDARDFLVVANTTTVQTLLETVTDLSRRCFVRVDSCV